MSINLLETITGALGKDFAPLAGQMFGESSADTGNAMQHILPTILGGLVSKGSTASGASGLLSLLNSPQVDSGLLSNVAGMLGGSSTNNGLLSAAPALIGQLFGANKLGGIADAIGSLANVRSSSASGILSLAVPLVMGWLKNHATTNKLDAGGLQSLLGGQSGFLKGKLNDSVMGAAGLGTAASLFSGFASNATAAAAKPVAAAAATMAAVPAAGGSMFGKLIPWIIAGAAGLFLLSQLKSCGTEKKVAEAPKVEAPAPAPVVAAPAVVTPAPAPAVVATEAAQAPALLKVFFETNSVAVPADLAPKVTAFAAYAKSSPNTKIGISGYNDKTGDPAKNAELSKNRAKALKDFLISAGVPDDRIILKRPEDTVGSTNDSEARRVEVYVVQ